MTDVPSETRSPQEMVDYMRKELLNQEILCGSALTSKGVSFLELLLPEH